MKKTREEQIAWARPTPAQTQMRKDLLSSKSAMEKQVGGTHYKGMKIQHFTFCQVNRIPWGEAAAIKYICRHREKNGKEDLLKAIHYLEMVIEQEYPDPAGKRG